MEEIKSIKKQPSMKIIFKVTLQKQNPAGYKNDCKSWFYSERKLACDKAESIKNAFEVLGFEIDWKYDPCVDSTKAILFNAVLFNINYETYEINCEKIRLDP